MSTRRRQAGLSRGLALGRAIPWPREHRALQVSGLGDREDLGMVLALAQDPAEMHPAAAVRRGLGEHGEELGQAHVEGAAGGQRGCRRERAQRIARRLISRYPRSAAATGRPVLGERRRIEDDGVEPLARAGQGAQRLERVALAPLDVGEPVERGIGGAPRQGVARSTSSASTLLGPPGEVQGERAVVGEAVERPPARRARARRPAGGWAADRETRRSSARPTARPGSGRRPRAPRSRAGTAPRASVHGVVESLAAADRRHRAGAESPRARNSSYRAPSTIVSRMVSSPAERIWTTSQRS